MIKPLAVAMLFALCTMSQYVMAVPEDDLFKITRGSEIEQIGKTKKTFIFVSTMSYTFDAGLSGSSFTMALEKFDLPDTANSIIKAGFVIAFAVPRRNEKYNARQVAFYTNTDKTTFLAERCDAEANDGEGACVLTGYISYNNKRWVIDSLNETHYSGMGSDEDSVSYSTIINEANNWKNGVEEPSFPDDSDTHSMFRRDIHERHRRSVATTCNIFEAVAVADATVWRYFVDRNGGNETLAEDDVRQHYDALFREIDLIYSSLPDSLCLRVYLRDVVIQKNILKDWSLFTAIGNVNLSSSIPRCAKFNTAGADGPFCFTRIPIQFGTIVSGIRGACTFTSACDNDTVGAAILQDNHNGLSRLAALLVGVQLDANVLACTTNAAVNNTFRVDDFASTEPSDPTDYSITYSFSTCSVDILSARIDKLNNQSKNCLLHGNLTDEQFLSLVNHRRLAGEIVALNHQCELAFGVGNYACDLYNSTSGLVIPNTAICGAGAFCTNNGTCVSKQTIVYSGTTCGTNKICFKGVCKPDFDCGGLPVPPNGFFTSSGDSSFRATAHLNCFPGTNTTANVTIKCLRDGWQGPSENCTGPIVTTTAAPTTTFQPTTSNFVVTTTTAAPTTTTQPTTSNFAIFG